MAAKATAYDYTLFSYLNHIQCSLSIAAWMGTFSSRERPLQSGWKCFIYVIKTITQSKLGMIDVTVAQQNPSFSELSSISGLFMILMYFSAVWLRMPHRLSALFPHAASFLLTIISNVNNAQTSQSHNLLPTMYSFL